MNDTKDILASRHNGSGQLHTHFPTGLPHVGAKTESGEAYRNRRAARYNEYKALCALSRSIHAAPKGTTPNPLRGIKRQLTELERKLAKLEGQANTYNPPVAHTIQLRPLNVGFDGKRMD